MFWFVTNLIESGALSPSSESTVTCWSRQITPGLVKEILAIGKNLGYKYLDFCILHENISYFDSFEYELSEEHDIFMECPLKQ